MFNPSSACSRGAAMLAGVLAVAPLMAHAQAYKCALGNGSTAYQSTPCPTNAKPAPHPTAAQLNALRAATPKDDKPYDDPYKNSVSERPHPQAPAFQAPQSPYSVSPGATRAPDTSTLVADVQARNRLANKQAAFNETHPSEQRMANCQTARENVNVLNEQRPVYTYDDKGNHKYVEDKDRPAAIATARQQVTDNCR